MARKPLIYAMFMLKRIGNTWGIFYTASKAGKHLFKLLKK